MTNESVTDEETDPNQILIKETFLDTLPTTGKGPQQMQQQVPWLRQTQQPQPQQQPQAGSVPCDRNYAGDLDFE